MIRKFQAGGIILVLFGGSKNGSSNRSRFLAIIFGHRQSSQDASASDRVE
jgi:hypothetical protein